MKKLTKIFSFLLFFVLFTVSCNNDKEEYFARPSWLEPTIYEVLQEQGRFTNYLKCVDRTLYKSTLKASGFYTVVAPNDDAFATFLASRNLTSVDQLSDSLVKQIVAYSLISNKYIYENLSDVLYNGWDTLTSIKKRTTHYETIHREEYQGQSIWVYDMPYFSVGDNNYKYIPFYLSEVFEKSRTSAQAASDYSIFYSNTYTGKNVQNANIIKTDLMAENGVIHEIDNVLEPLPTLEKLLNDPDYSSFKELLNLRGSTGEPYFLTYNLSSTATKYFQEAMPDSNINAVYLKTYSGLTFNLNFERYGSTIRDAEQGGNTLFAPNNAAVAKFNEYIKDYYPGGIKTASNEIIGYFLNAQLSSNLVWPGDYKGSMNDLGEFLNGVGNRGDDFNASNYTKIKPASNGFFYGGDNYIRSRYFETVFTEVLLNRDYNLFKTAFTEYFASTLQEELLQCAFNGYTQENYTVLMPSDELLSDDGFRWQWISASNKYGFTHTQSGSTLGNFDVATRMQRLVRSHIFKRLKNNDVDCSIPSFVTDPSFETAYGGYSYAVNEYGDMIRYKDGKIQMLGNFDESDWVTAIPYKTFSNGQVFKIDKLLQYSRRNTYPNSAEGYTMQDLWIYILNMSAGTQNTNIALFKNYMNACIKGTESNELAGLSADATYTIFMPTNKAMSDAITKGYLPSLTSINADVASRNKATAFILYHILKGKIFVDDGLTYIMPNREVIKEEVWPTAHKDVVDNTYLAVRKDASGNLLVSTQVESTGKELSTLVKTAKVTRGIKRSNYFGAKAILHEIDDYFIYQKAIE